MEETLTGKDNETRGVVVRVKAGRGASSFLRRPIQRLYPLEVQHKKGTTENNSTTESNSITTIDQSSGTFEKKDNSTDADVSVPTTDRVLPQTIVPSGASEPIDLPISHPRRRAATEARNLIVARLLDN